MLVLSRKLGEEIVINGNIVVVVTAIGGSQVRIGVSAPRDVPVHRSEIAAAAAAFRTPERAPLRPSRRRGDRAASPHQPR
jgi:carbon storage regulator